MSPVDSHPRTRRPASPPKSPSRTSAIGRRRRRRPATPAHAQDGDTTERQGAGFGADLYKLDRAGRETLPTVARQFAIANGHVADTDRGLAIAFTRPGQFGGEKGPVYEAWTELRDAYQTILAATATNLELVGEALSLTATEYAKTDDAARDRLNELKKNALSPVDIPALEYPHGPTRSGMHRK